MSVEYSCYVCGVDLDEDHDIRYIGEYDAFPICRNCLDTTYEIRTNHCPMCGERSTVTVDRKGFTKWQNGMLAQEAFPEMKTETREILITGTHPECWDEMWADSDETN